MGLDTLLKQQEKITSLLNGIKECIHFSHSLEVSFKSLKEQFQECDHWLDLLGHREEKGTLEDKLSLIANSKVLDYTFKHCVGNFESAIERAKIYKKYISDLNEKIQEYKGKNKSKKDITE